MKVERFVWSLLTKHLMRWHSTSYKQATLASGADWWSEASRASHEGYTTWASGGNNNSSYRVAGHALLTMDIGRRTTGRLDLPCWSWKQTGQIMRVLGLQCGLRNDGIIRSDPTWARFISDYMLEIRSI